MPSGLGEATSVRNAPTADAAPGAEEGSEAGEDPEVDLPGLFPDRWHHTDSITAQYLYTGEGFQNAHGGLQTRGAARYRGNFDLTLTLDTQSAGLWQDGSVFIYFQQAHGTTLSPRFVGDSQLYSNLDTSPKPQDLTQVGEYWYRHSWNDGETTVKLGRQDANADFAFADLAGDYVNSSFATLPNVPLPYWPFQTLGVSGISQCSPFIRVGGGIYDQGADIGQWWMNTASRGMFSLVQVDLLPFAEQEDALLLQIRLGGWYTTSNTLGVVDSSIHQANYGLYTTIDKMLWTESESSEQGLGVFFQAAWCPPDRNQVDRHAGGGLVYRGLFDGRDADTIGCGFTSIFYSQELQDVTGQRTETAIEAFYKARLRDWLALQPDLQYIAHPTGLNRDSLVAGLRFELVF